MVELMAYLTDTRIRHHADIHSHFEVMQSTAREGQQGVQANIGGSMRPIINVGALQGRTFLPDPDEDGVQERHRVEGIAPTDMTTADGREKLWEFRCRRGAKVFQEIMTYNQMLGEKGKPSWVGC